MVEFYCVFLVFSSPKHPSVPSYTDDWVVFYPEMIDATLLTALGVQLLVLFQKSTESVVLYCTFHACFSSYIQLDFPQLTVLSHSTYTHLYYCNMYARCILGNRQIDTNVHSAALFSYET